MDDIFKDLEGIAQEVNQEFNIEFRDPYEDPYLQYRNGEPRSTDSQERAWQALTEEDMLRIAMIASKGSGKTHFGATWAFHWGQKHPGSKGCIVANTDRQAQDAAGDAFVRVANILGYQTEYFRSKKIGGQQYSKFYIVDLDGKGYEDGHVFMLMVRSFESVGAMEGSEFDFMWVEEIQDTNRDNFQVAFSRNRGDLITQGDKANPLYIAGMTESELHWMYALLEDKMGYDTLDEYDPETSKGLLLEPTIFENKINLGESTIEGYMETMDSNTAQRHIYAKRTSSSSNLVLHEYRDDIHRKGRMSSLLCHYSPYSDLYISIDFNVSPMSATLWQEKRWSDEWFNDGIFLEWEDQSNGVVRRVVRYDEAFDGSQEVVEEWDSLEDYARPDTSVLAQVDEFEIWPNGETGVTDGDMQRWSGRGGTEGLIRAIVREYQDHSAQVVITGDAKGNDRRSSSLETDWMIIQKHASKMGGDVAVVPGLIANSDLKKGETKYSNPRVEDTINVLNAHLMNAKGEVRVCFLPTSRYESGGAAASCASTERKPDGRIDERPDRREGKEVRRTHFFDTVRYIVWFWSDGLNPSGEQFNQMVEDMEQMHREDATSHEDSWGDNLDDGFGDFGGGDEWLF